MLHRPLPVASRRHWMLGAFAALAGGVASLSRAHTVAAMRLGILQFGTAQWIADVIRRRTLDAQHGFALQTVTLANTDAGRVALMARAADVVVSDWIFVASQRAVGTNLCFAPFSSAAGGIMVPAASRIGSLTNLSGHRLGVAGGPLDKSWLIVRAAARSKHGLDLAAATEVIYGAPPLLEAKLRQGELDAVLTFWNFAARLQAAGCREIVSVADCTRTLGMLGPVPLVGYVFHADWAETRTAVIDGFLAASAAAEKILAASAEEWQRIRPLMNAPDDALFQALQQRFLQGTTHVSAEQQRHSAGRLFDLLLATGGPPATGGLTVLPDGIFWRNPYG
jgi:NitT/TauT family transport system substrate-binding protein